MSTTATATAATTANTLSVDTGSQVDINSQNSAASSEPPALASFNGNLYMAYVGSVSSNLYICYYDGTSWQGQTKITSQNDAKSGSSPALAAFNGQLYLAFRGSVASTSLYICSSSDGVNWGSQTNITDQNGAQTSSPPALAAFNGSLYLAYRGWGTSNSLYVSSPPTAPPGAARPMSAIRTAPPPMMAPPWRPSTAASTWASRGPGERSSAVRTSGSARRPTAPPGAGRRTWPASTAPRATTAWPSPPTAA